MLNKELLLIPKKESDLEYTHEIVVGASGALLGYSAKDGYGSINPSSF